MLNYPTEIIIAETVSPNDLTCSRAISFKKALGKQKFLVTTGNYERKKSALPASVSPETRCSNNFKMKAWMSTYSYPLLSFDSREFVPKERFVIKWLS